MWQHAIHGATFVSPTVQSDDDGSPDSMSMSPNRATHDLKGQSDATWLRLRRCRRYMSIARMHQFEVATFTSSDFDRHTLVGHKGDQRVSVCIPARNEAATVGEIVAAVHDHLMMELGLVDELIVIDDHSNDDTALVAAGAGAKVIPASEILPDHATSHGKGEALWRSLYASSGEIVVWCDADLVDFDTSFIIGLVGPLLIDPSLLFVKGKYDRPLDGYPDGGGRVTELMARPALAVLFPELNGISQPLGGEYAGRRYALESLPFTRGYGVDIGLLIDVARTHGLAQIAQVDLGCRRHRNRTYDDLTPMAAQVLAAIVARAEPRLAAESRSVDHKLTVPLADGTAIEVSSGNLPPIATITSHTH